MEVETPTLWPEIGGAAARPFETKAHALNLDMRMRISPELFLKVSRGHASWDWTCTPALTTGRRFGLSGAVRLHSGWWSAGWTACTRSASSSATKARARVCSPLVLASWL